MAETKKVKVIEVEFNREYKPQGKSFSVFYFNIKADDGFNILEGEFSTNGKNQKKFLVDESYEVTIVEKQTARGKYLFFDRVKNEDDPNTSGPQKKGNSYKYVKSRKEAITIILQSSYESAILAFVKFQPDSKGFAGISGLAGIFTDFVVTKSGLNSSLCKTGDPDALKAANEESIVYQKSLKLAIECLALEVINSLSVTQNISKSQALIFAAEIIHSDMKEILKTKYGL